MALSVEYERLGGPRALPRAERRRRVVQNVERMQRGRLMEDLAASEAALIVARKDRDALAARVEGWRVAYFALARDARRLYLGGMVGWGLALVLAVAFVVRLATGG